MNRPEARDPHRDAAWLADALREQADAHEAELSRIEARFERLVTDESRGAERRAPQRRLRLRLIGIPLGALAALATATIAVGVTIGIGNRPTHPANQAAVSPSPGHPTAGARPPASAALHPAGTASSHSESSPAPSSSPPPSPSPRPLTATGTVDSHSTQYWAQEDLTVTATSAIEALQVTVTVSGGTTVRSTGSWSTILSANLNTTLAQTPAGLVCVFALKPGQILQPGTYAFGFQFDRPTSGHSFSLDTYTVTATTIDRAKQTSVSGTFTG